MCTPPAMEVSGGEGQRREREGERMGLRLGMDWEGAERNKAQEWGQGPLHPCGHPFPQARDHCLAPTNLWPPAQPWLPPRTGPSPVPPRRGWIGASLDCCTRPEGMEPPGPLHLPFQALHCQGRAGCKTELWLVSGVGSRWQLPPLHASQEAWGVPPPPAYLGMLYKISKTQILSLETQVLFTVLLLIH